MTRTLNRKQWRKITLACAIAVLAVGCTSNEPVSPKPPTTPAATTTVTPEPSKTPADPAEAAKKEAIATYLSHWKEVEKRYADKTGKAGDLKRYAAAAALAQVEQDSKNMREKKVLLLGAVTVGNPVAVSADVNRKIPNVTISSCLDISRWRALDADTQKPIDLPKERLLRYVIKTTVEKWPEGWRVIRDEPQDKKC